ncbi:NADPH-dependent F420 reductase [Pectobacterium parmentieri]|uniref:NADP oxidoreductase n=1 Tax=Pectobacterium parmentieri TaxID=1905730 RepID=A0A0H3IEC3_PECPM|nr:NAD(P)-binding domain-containing protein [Pectobacterium parmentieri]AFI92427.1 NADP oxidoreductase coenzyme F420-dependent [Pectobacterium parmentieri]AYH07644.1 NADP oxidoreductase [Pectobacterium parmentieri]AYH16397.1 NADP oxidoreductase [Pectobacterium parmentieri]AYH25097.1 NADP oxidoreductase [Pectobacterium parmentieri]MBI0472263.1 NADP oxidoreductase [Pectobacterium parmentieri]
MKIGIIGAGFVGRAIAKLALQNGHQVMLSNSRDPQSLFSLRPMIGCDIGTATQAALFGDIIVIAVPFTAIDNLPTQALQGKSVIDAVNYYTERDGKVAALDTRSTTTSELLAGYLLGTKITKAFNAIPMTQLESDGLPAGSANRRALPLAGDDEREKAIVAELYDAFGFDVVDAGKLSEGWRFERNMPSYCIRMTKAELTAALALASRESTADTQQG